MREISHSILEIYVSTVNKVKNVDDDFENHFEIHDTTSNLSVKRKHDKCETFNIHPQFEHTRAERCRREDAHGFRIVVTFSRGNTLLPKTCTVDRWWPKLSASTNVARAGFWRAANQSWRPNPSMHMNGVESRGPHAVLRGARHSELKNRYRLCASYPHWFLSGKLQVSDHEFMVTLNQFEDWGSSAVGCVPMIRNLLVAEPNTVKSTIVGLTTSRLVAFMGCATPTTPEEAIACGLAPSIW